MTQVGTPIFISPEIVMGDYYSEKTDVFSFAMTVLQYCLKGEPLIEYLKEKLQADTKKNEVNLSRVSHEVVTAGWRPNTDGIDAPQSVLDLLVLCWSSLPEERPSFEEIIDYAQTEVRNEVMGEEGGGSAESNSGRRMSTSGELSVRITAAKSLQEDEEAREKERGGAGGDEGGGWEARCEELERELKEFRDERGAEVKRGKTEMHVDGYLKDMGRDV